ncbi:transcription termination factor Rho [Rickettsiales bacterium (ex Bugula neritina AB1)]|nr:transcription termination factor Rho [Rickettsiales bacterium (ex Bugula neritina AB1)]
MNFDEIKALSLKDICKYINSLENFTSNNIGNKEMLLGDLIKYFHMMNYNIKITGYLEILQDYGVLRYMENNYLLSNYDIHVYSLFIKKYQLKKGDKILGIISAKKNNNQNTNEKFLPLGEIVLINDILPSVSKKRYDFVSLTPCYPTEQIVLEDLNTSNKERNISMRLIDITAPLARGQRMLIVAPPKAGKTTLLRQMAESIMAKYQDIYLIILLIDERPEEVTEMIKIIKKGEVISSTFDESPENHIKVAEMAIAKAKRMVENHQHVVIFLDSITRLARAYNSAAPANSGKILSGGLDPNAVVQAKKILGAARNTQEAGSLTLISTSLIDNISKGDQLLFEEFKGTGNAEIVLSRELAQKDIYPAIKIEASGTREDNRFIKNEIWRRIRVLNNFLLIKNMSPEESINFLKERIKVTMSNEDMLMKMNTKSSF